MGVDFRAKVTRAGAAFNSTPYFIQYVKNKDTETVNGTTNVTIKGFRLDGPQNDVAGRPEYYGLQEMFAGFSTMNDFPGLPITLREKPKGLFLEESAYPDFEVQSRFDPTTGGRQYKMLRSIPDELAVNATHAEDFLKSRTWEWQFQTYVAENAAGVITPRGRIEWGFKIVTTAAGYQVQYSGPETYIGGKDDNVWNL